MHCMCTKGTLVKAQRHKQTQYSQKTYPYTNIVLKYTQADP